MTGEKQLQTAIIKTAKLLGWKVAHFGNTVKIVRRGDTYKTIPDKGAAGFPDLVLVRPPRIIFAELKTKHGQMTVDQAEWLHLLSECKNGHASIEAYVWRPADWDSRVIQRRLK